jgi:hypothetical protein
MRAAAIMLCLLAVPVAAEQPWETHVDLRVPAPIELPAPPAANPFAAALVVQPVLLASPLRAKLAIDAAAQAMAYVDADGACRRVVFTRLPLPGLETDLTGALTRTEFTPGRRLGAPAAAWTGVVIDLRGRIDEGTTLDLAAKAPDPSTPPTPERTAAPAFNPDDAGLASTPPEQLDQLPATRRFRAKVSGQTFRQEVQLLVEVGANGAARRVVFLACPEGLRPWLLASLSGWQFQPGRVATGPVTAWTRIGGAIEVKVGTLRSDALRITREGVHPPAAGGPSDGPPPGA